MYDITYWTFLNPLNGSISVYIAEKPATLTGALVFNDYISEFSPFLDENC